MNSERIKQQLEKVRLSYIESLEEKKNSIGELWLSLQEEWSPDKYDSLYLIVHSIAGSAETFGLPELTRQARIAVDQLKLLEPTTPPINGLLINGITNELKKLTIDMNNILKNKSDK